MCLQHSSSCNINVLTHTTCRATRLLFPSAYRLFHLEELYLTALLSVAARLRPMHILGPGSKPGQGRSKGGQGYDSQKWHPR